MEGEEEEEEEWYACPVPLWAVPCPYAAAELACPQQCVFAHSAATQQRVLRQYMHRRAHNKQEKKKLDNSEAQQHSLFDKEESNDKESSVVVKDSNDKDIKDISHKDHGSLRVDPLFRLRSVGVGSRSSSRIALYNTGTTALSVSAVQLDASLGISLSLFAVEGRTAVEGRVVLDVPLSVPPKGQRSVAVELRECLVVGTYRCFARFIYHSLSSPAAELVSPPVQLLCHVLLQDDVQAASLLDKNAVSFYPPSVRNCWLTPLPSKSASWSTPRFSESIAWTPLELALYINALAGPNKLVKLSTIKGCGDPLAFNALNFCKFNSPLLFLTSDSGIQTTADLSQLSSNMQVPSPRYSNINEHIRRLNQLLLLEELAMDETCKAYDEFFVEVTVKQHVASFRIAGTAEFRPQLLRGDVLLIRSPDTSYPFQIVARVLGVQQGQVTVALPSLPRPLPAKIHVRFVWNRVRFRRMFLALFDFLAFLPCRILVGDIGQASRVLTADEVRDRPVFDQRLSVEQRRAVFTMVDRRIVGEPFLLIGSAGSGKTETIVELVFQAITANAASRVLVVAPSNGAADVLALRLITRVKSLLRLNAHTRPATEVLGNGALLPYCFVNSSGMHDMPPRETLQATSVVVATCAAAGWIRESFGTDILFDLVIVDEAAQATEPETLIPLTLVQPNLGRIMLCGDCKQLGPNLRSRVAIEKGLVSLLQRLSEQGLCASVALTQNFRCHPKLMEISSHLFYNNGVTASLDPAIANRFLEYEDLCGSRFPVVFYGVNGLDEREVRKQNIPISLTRKLTSFFPPCRTTALAFGMLSSRLKLLVWCKSCCLAGLPSALTTLVWCRPSIARCG